MATSTAISCRWDWCRSSFSTIDALDTHVKHDHVWPMKPLRKAEIALMRRMDLQSLHSSLEGITSSFTRSAPKTVMTPGPTSVSRSKTPSAVPPTSVPQIHDRPENGEFNTFTQLSSPPQTHSPKKLPVSPAFDGLVRQDVHSGLSAAVEMFERTHGHKTNQRGRHQQSPTHRPHSWSSGSSQEVVEQQLTQDNAGSQPPLASEDRLVDPELRWPTDDESDVLPSEEIRDSEQLVFNPLGSSPNSTRGHIFRCGSLNVPLNIISHGASSPNSLAVEESHSQSQPFVLQTQAPYSSQATGWSQT